MKVEVDEAPEDEETVTGDQSLYIVLLIITRISARQRYKSQGGETQEAVASYGYLPRRSPRARERERILNLYTATNKQKC